MSTSPPDTTVFVPGEWGAKLAAALEAGEPVFAAERKDRDGRTTFELVECHVRRELVGEFRSVFRPLPRALFQTTASTAIRGSLSIPAGLVSIKGELAASEGYSFLSERTGAYVATSLPDANAFDHAWQPCADVTHVASNVFTGAIAIVEEAELEGELGTKVFGAGLSVGGHSDVSTKLVLGEPGCTDASEMVSCRSPVGWTLVPLPPTVDANCTQRGDGGTCAACTIEEKKVLQTHQGESAWSFYCGSLPKGATVEIEIRATMDILPRYEAHSHLNRWGELAVSIAGGGGARQELSQNGALDFLLRATTIATTGTVSGVVTTTRCTRGDPGSTCQLNALATTINVVRPL